MSSKEWTFEDTSNWGHECSETDQSPVNIDTGLADSCKDLCDLEFNYQPSICPKDKGKCSTLVSFHKHQNLKISYNKGSNIIYKNTPYSLKEITFHTPSLHHIDGMHYDLEICLIHSLDDNPYTSNGVIVSCLFNEGDYYGTTERFVHQFINEVKIDSEEEINVSPEWNAAMVLPKKRSFYIYKGSLPFPPCSSMTNIVMDTVGSISPINLELLKLNLGKNNRPVQSLKGRPIYYNSGKTIKLHTDDRDVKKSDNIYKRCVKIDEKRIPKVSETNSSDTTFAPDVSGLSVKTKTTVKNVFLLLVISSVFVHSVFLTKYLFKIELAQVLIVALVGAHRLNSGNLKEVIEKWRSSAICKPPVV
jgi:carbonic anhydrase